MPDVEDDVQEPPPLPHEARIAVERDKLALERARLELEHERFELERQRFEAEAGSRQREERFFRKHAGEVLAGAVTLAGVLVSAANIVVANLEKNKELKIQESQKDKELKLQQIQKDAELQSIEKNAQAKLEQDRAASGRDYEYRWQLDMLQFVDKHSDQIFSSRPEDVARMRSIMLVSFPPKQVGSFFAGLQQAATSEPQKKVWEQGIRLAVERTDPAKVLDTAQLPSDGPPPSSAGYVPVVASSCTKFEKSDGLTEAQCRITCWDKGQVKHYNVNEVVPADTEALCSTRALRRCVAAQNSFCGYAWKSKD